MTSLEDHAEGYGGPEIVLTADLPHCPPGQIVTADLHDCDDLTPEGTFPQHGVFLEVETGDGSEFWECPGSMAQAVMEQADEKELEPEGAILSVDQVAKQPGGEWSVTVTLSEPADGS